MTRSQEFADGVNHLTNDRPTDSHYGEAGSVEGPDFDYERRWSQGYDD